MEKETHIYYTYQLRDSRSDKPFYIGKGKEFRAWDHFKDDSETHKANTIKKIIREGYEVKVEILYDNMPEKIAFALERLFIKRYGRRDIGTGILTNMTDGGEGTSGRKATKEQRIAMSERQLEIMANPEVKQRHQEACKSAMQRPETKARISATSKGRYVKESTKELNRLRASGENNPMYGKTGDKSPITGRKNIHHPDTLELKLISSEEIEYYINLGWKTGRLPGTANKSSTGNKMVYNPDTKEVKSLPVKQLNDYLSSGWKLGRRPKQTN